MDSTFGLYASTNEQHLFYEMKPEVSARQRELLSALYAARRTIGDAHRASLESLEKAAEMCDYEPDVAQYILTQLDDHYVNLIVEKMKKARK